MNLKNHPPILVPHEFRPEIEKLSKAALMDMVWDYAFQIAEENPTNAMQEFRNRREIVLRQRSSNGSA